MALVAYGELEPATDHHAALLALVDERHLTGFGTGLVALVEDLDAAIGELVAPISVELLRILKTAADAAPNISYLELSNITLVDFSEQADTEHPRAIP